MTDVQIALNRFGLGARGGMTAPADPRRWLLDQLASYDPSPAPIAALPRSPAMVAQLAELRDERKDRKEERAAASAQPAATPAAMTETMPPAAPAKPQNPGAGLYKPLRDSYVAAAAARMQVAATTETPFVERLVAFWSNHFAISIDKAQIIGLAGTFENEAIRPHVMGRFADMLGAVERHPAMLLFLDQAQSIGPGSMIAERAAMRGGQRKRGLNENLAREIMELHTLGVRSGYTQADVTEFARALTGWTFTGLGPLANRFAAGSPGTFAFIAPLHEPGSRTVMGKRYDQQGEAQAQAVLTDLATSPATARHLATKLARHFAADDPPPALVARLETAYLKSGGDLPTVYRALIEASEAWAAGTPKFRQPWEWLVAVQRATGIESQPQQVVFALNQLGQPLWKPGSPAGWDDIAASWAAPDALLRRVELADRFAQRASATIDARKLAPTLFAGSLSESTAQSLARAESGAQALSLLLVSPEMLRR